MPPFFHLLRQATVKTTATGIVALMGITTAFTETVTAKGIVTVGATEAAFPCYATRYTEYKTNCTISKRFVFVVKHFV